MVPRYIKLSALQRWCLHNTCIMWRAPGGRTVDHGTLDFVEVFESLNG
jgi:hypothetical protein